MAQSLEGWPTKAKESPSPHEVRLAQLDTNPVFLCGKLLMAFRTICLVTQNIYLNLSPVYQSELSFVLFCYCLFLFFRWGTHLYMSLLSVHLSVCLSVCCAPYLKNHVSSNHNFWYTCVKWWYLLAFFKLFLNVHFLGCYRGKSAKNSPKWKIITCVTCRISRAV